MRSAVKSVGRLTCVGGKVVSAFAVFVEWQYGENLHP